MTQDNRPTSRSDQPDQVRYTVHAMPGPDDQDPGRALFTGLREECYDAMKYLISKKGWSIDNLALIDNETGRYASFVIKW